MKNNQAAGIGDQRDHGFSEVTIEDPARLLTVVQAAELLQLSPKTLANWASAGTGPRRVKLTARDIRYRRSDLMEFIAEKLESA